MKRRAIIITVVFIALAATGAFAATRIHEDGDGKAKAPARSESAATELGEIRVAEIKPVNVETETVELGTLSEYVEVNGTAAARTDVTFSSETAGKVEYLGADLGDRVKKGQVLARVDFSTQRAEKDAAEAGFELAQTTYRRLKALGTDVVSQQQIDEARSAMIQAAAGLEIFRSALSKSVTKTTIRGTVSQKLVEEAEYVMPGTPLFRVVDLSVVVVEAQLPETQVALVGKGAKAAVRIGALGEEFEGAVEAVVPTADPVAKTFTVRVEVDNPDQRILAGMSATLKIAARTYSDVVVVPQDIVVEGKAGRSVFVASNGSAVQRAVRLGAVDGDRVVILEGVAPGEEIVTVGQRDLTDGQPIRVVR